MQMIDLTDMPLPIQRCRGLPASDDQALTLNPLGFRLGTAPPPVTSILGLLLRAIYNHIIVIIQLLLSEGSTRV